MMVTAKILEPPQDFTTQFTIDARSCPTDLGDKNDTIVKATTDEETTVQATDEETAEKNQDDNFLENENSNMIRVTISISIAILLLVIVAVVVILRRRGGYRKPVKVEENDIYGVYSRAWGGEGDYGDGDKVYVTDNNDYYAVN